MSLVILTNFHGADIYAIAKALYAAIPDFTCGNKRDDKVDLCFWERNVCVPRFFASWLIRYGATLGECEKCSVPFAKSMNESNAKSMASTVLQNNLKAFPNPFISTVSFSFKVSESGPASIRLYDMNGKLLAIVFNGFVQKGVLQKVDFNGGKLPVGMYLSRLQTTKGSSEYRLVRNR